MLITLPVFNFSLPKGQPVKTVSFHLNLPDEINLIGVVMV